MTREIKFRAYYLSSRERDAHETAYAEWSSDWEGFSLSFALDNPDYAVVQYTGLHDKHGTEIFEGDIVSVRFYDPFEVAGGGYSYENGVIRWNEKSSAFKWFALDEDPSDENNYWLTHAEAEGREVIGDIHANPELLTV